MGLLATLATVFLGTGAWTVAAADAAGAASADAAERTVVIGLAGVTWPDVADDRPGSAFRALADTWWTANQVARSTGSSSCPADGWLALSSGARVWDRVAGGCRKLDSSLITETGPSASRGQTGALAATVVNWSALATGVAGSSPAARLGVLADQAKASSLTTAAIGPGAALALADNQGVVAGSTFLPDGLPALRDASEQAARTAALTVVDLTLDGAPTTLATYDQRLAAVLDGLRAVDPDLSATTVTVSSLADGFDSEGARAMQVFARHLPGRDGPGVITSAATRQPGLVLTTNALATTLADVGIDPASANAGAAVEIADRNRDDESGSERLAALTSAAEHSALGERAQLPVMLSYGGMVALIAALATVLRPGRHRSEMALRAAALTAAYLPVSFTLANAFPWWLSGRPIAAFLTLSLSMASILTAVTWLIARTRPLGQPASRVAMLTASLVTWAVLAADVARGAVWQLSNPLGVQPLQAGRFYGMNNTAFSFFAVAALVVSSTAGTWLTQRFGRRVGLITAAGIALVSVIVNAAPALGADLGGPLALIPAALVAIAAVGRWRVRVRTWAALAIGTVGVVALIAIVDHQRPAASRTHLGAFVQQVLDGQGGTVIARKASSAFLTAFTNPLGLSALIAALIVAALLVWTWRDSGFSVPRWTGALAVLAVIGSLVNDSGIAIAGWVALLSGSLFVVRRGSRSRLRPGR